MRLTRWCWSPTSAALFLFFRGANLQQQASTIQEDVPTIRGRSFVSPVIALFSSREDTAAYIEAQLARLTWRG